MKQNKGKKVRPDKVSIATTLLWITIAMGVVRGIMEFPNSLKMATGSGFDSGFVIFAIIFSLAFMAFFIYKIREGKNWARITFLVLFVIGIPFMILHLFQFLSTNLISGILGIGQSILQIIALVFLFQKSSSNWFKAMKSK